MVPDDLGFLEYLPEIGVSCCFFPVGLVMGYLLNGQHFIKRPGAYYMHDYYGKHYFAIQISIGAAIFTAFVLHILKLRRKNREHFHHLKLIIFGLILLLLNGSAFLTNYKVFDYMVIGAAGQGIVYISGLCYINIRIKHHRALRISVSFLWYFLGISLAVQFIEDTMLLGLILCTSTSALILILLVITTLKPTGRLQYDRSLDDDINSGFYTQTRSQLLDYLQTKHVLGKDLYIGKESYASSHLFMLFIKLQSALLFQAVFLVKAGEKYNFGDLVGANWAACAGVVVGALLLFVFSTRVLFLTINMLNPFLFAYAVIQYIILQFVPPFEPYTQSQSQYDQRGPVAYLSYIAVLASTYFVGDMAILDTAPIKWTEAYLAMGFAIERLAIIYLHYAIFEQNNAYLLVIQLILATVVFVIVLLFAFAKMPKTFDKSLTQIKFNLFWGIKYGYENEVHETLAARAGMATPQAATPQAATPQAATPQPQPQDVPLDTVSVRTDRTEHNNS